MRRWRAVLGDTVKCAAILAAAWVVLCALLGALVFVAGALLEGPIAIGDRAVLAWLHGLRIEWAMEAIRQVSFAGRPEITVPLMWLGAGVVFLAGARREALQTVVTYLGAGNVYLVLAPIFHRPRPRLFDDVPFADGWALPSGHVIGALAAALPLAIAVARKWPRAGTAAGAIALGYAGTVAATRLYLQLHHLSDVLVAWWITGVWYVLSDAVIERWWAQRRRVPAATGAVNGTTSASRTSARASGEPAEDLEGRRSGDVGSLRRA